MCPITLPEIIAIAVVVGLCIIWLVWCKLANSGPWRRNTLSTFRYNIASVSRPETRPTQISPPAYQQFDHVPMQRMNPPTGYLESPSTMLAEPAKIHSAIDSYPGSNDRRLGRSIVEGFSETTGSTIRPGTEWLNIRMMRYCCSKSAVRALKEPQPEIIMPPGGASSMDL
ncbi:hypothetical protein K438DRAFT_1787573 [Mycena galopus ATCC 62051]|nr:hypothetical protein K438DRAFT_1787573 [Mycena galopus ATCC 62051]